MAKYTYESIMSELKSGVYQPIYYLMGEEGYYTDRITDYIIENSLTEVERDFNLTVFYGLETDIDTVVTAAKRFPMMAERQVIVVREAQLLKNIDNLLFYLQNPQPTTVLVFAHKNGSIDKRKKVATELERKEVVLDSKKMKDDNLPWFINACMREKGLTADNKSVQMIRESIGADLSRIAGEIDKLAIAMPQGTTSITPELVEHTFKSFRQRKRVRHRAGKAQNNLTAKDTAHLYRRVFKNDRFAHRHLTIACDGGNSVFLDGANRRASKFHLAHLLNRLDSPLRQSVITLLFVLNTDGHRR